MRQFLELSLSIKRFPEKSLIDLYVQNFPFHLMCLCEGKGLAKAITNLNLTFIDKVLGNIFSVGLIKSIFPRVKVMNCQSISTTSTVSILRKQFSLCVFGYVG